MEKSQFDRLPDELLVKIFKYIVQNYDRKSCHYRDGSRHQPTFLKQLNDICMACKRFNYIVNKVLMGDNEFGHLATLVLSPVNKSWSSPYEIFDMNYVPKYRGHDWSHLPQLYYKIKGHGEEPEYSPWEYKYFDLFPYTHSIECCGDYVAQVDNDDYDYHYPTLLSAPKLFTRTLNLFKVSNKPPSWCEFVNEDDCDCRDSRKRLAECKLKFRYLRLSSINLLRNCMPNFIEDKRTNLNSVVQLTLYSCEVNLVVLNKILTWMPRIEKLSCSPSIRSITRRSDIWSNGKISYEDSPVRTLSYLHFCSYLDIVADLADLFANIPAKIVDGEFAASRANLNLMGHYLLRHKETIGHFRFKLRGAEESGWQQYFEGLSITCFEHEKVLEITSSSCSHLDLNNIMTKLK